MAKPIPTTPILYGEDAEAVLREVEQGTPMTPERERILREAKEVFEKHKHVFTTSR